MLGQIYFGRSKQMLMLIEQFEKELISLGFALATALILYLFRARTELVYADLHQWVFLLPALPPLPMIREGESPPPPPALAPTINVFTRSIIVMNLGRQPATEVQLVFNWRPNFNIWPMRPNYVHTNPDGRFTLKFDSLAPKERFQVELIVNAALPDLINVRSKECLGRTTSVDIRGNWDWFLAAWP